jgi:phosphoribosylanthranilate isomerase
MFRVKICGITSIADALAAVDAGADAIGLNFCSASPRACDVATARAIADALPLHVVRVGVFVNAPADEIRRTVAEAGLNLVQLHGDEPPTLLQQIKPLAVMRAFRVAGGDLAAVDDYLQSCHRLVCLPRMVLVDALCHGQFGGTGQTVDWGAVAAARHHFRGMPLVLAGGLKPTNVAAAIAAVRPWGVDTASGVETAPGRKSAELMRSFVAEAMAALASVA